APLHLYAGRIQVLGEELALEYAYAVLAGERAAQADRRLEYLAGGSLHPLHLVRVFQVAQYVGVQVAVPYVPEHGDGQPVALRYLCDFADHRGYLGAGHRYVLAQLIRPQPCDGGRYRPPGLP